MRGNFVRFVIGKFFLKIDKLIKSPYTGSTVTVYVYTCI